MEVEHYIRAASRENTRKSYRAAVEHYEVSWGGVLPATADNIASYLAYYAPTLSIRTLKQRLAALASWHTEQGFPDPTKAPHVKKVLRGIAELHPCREKQAKPLQIEQLQAIDGWISGHLLKKDSRSVNALKLLRDRALILLGFWRAFRGDELTRISVENVSVIPGVGIEIFIPRSKTDRLSHGRSYRAPALHHLCPVTAFTEWVSAAQLTKGPAFPAINQWGHVAEQAIHPASVIAIIKVYCHQVDLPDADEFSSHSLRRGFATWATANNWDTKTLMEYVGWKDVQSAMRYIEGADPFSQQRIQQVLPQAIAQAKQDPELPKDTALEISLCLEPYSKHSHGTGKARSLIERHCLLPWAMEKLDAEGTRYRITISSGDCGALDEALDELLHHMHQIASDNQCMLEATIRDPHTDRVWD